MLNLSTDSILSQTVRVNDFKSRRFQILTEQEYFQKANKKPAESVLAATSLQEQSNQLINDPGVRNTHKGEQVLWESIHHTLFCVTPVDVVAGEQHNTFSAQMYECSIEQMHARTAKKSKPSFLQRLYWYECDWKKPEVKCVCACVPIIRIPFDFWNESLSLLLTFLYLHCIYLIQIKHLTTAPQGEGHVWVTPCYV